MDVSSLSNSPGGPQKPPALLGKQKMATTYTPDDCEQAEISGYPQPQDYSDLRFVRGVVIGLALSLAIWAGIIALVIG